MFSITTDIVSVKNASVDYPLRNVVSSGARMRFQCVRKPEFFMHGSIVVFTFGNTW
jgi:hypothetical protein